MAQSCDRIVRGLRRRGVAVDVLHFIPRERGRPWTIETQAAGRYLACPIEDDPAHALNRAWSTLEADPATRGITHVVAFGGSRPIMAAPVFAAWLGVPLITLIRGNDFDAAVFSIRRRPVLDEALTRSQLVCAVSQDKVDKIAALHPGVRVRRIPNGIDLSDWELAPSDRERAQAWRAATVTDGRRVLGLFGQLKAKKGGVFLLDALLRSGQADAFHLLLAGWMEPEMEAWLAEHEGSCTSPRSPSWIASSCCRGTRPATGSRSRRSTTGCRTCSSRRRRSGSRCSPRAPEGWPTCWTTGAPRCCSSRATRPAARGRSSAPRAWTRRAAGRWARRAGRWPRPSSTPSWKRRATSRRSLPRCGSRRAADVVLYYALGGGLGHLTRARQVLAALDLTDDAALLTASRFARDQRVTGELPVVQVPRWLGRDRAAFREWLAVTLADLRPQELIVDSFPGGILGELCGMELPPARHVARRLRWPAYAPRLDGPLPRYEVAYVLEPLEDRHAQALAHARAESRR